jgi:hypothetical protein
MAQLAAKMPWCYALDDTERQCLLGLLRKMLDAPAPDASTDVATGEAKAETPDCGQELAAIHPSVDDVSPR